MWLHLMSTPPLLFLWLRVPGLFLPHSARSLCDTKPFLITFFSPSLSSITITTSCFPVPSICFRDPVNDWFESLAQCLHWNVRKKQNYLSSEDEEFWGTRRLQGRLWSRRDSLVLVSAWPCSVPLCLLWISLTKLQSKTSVIVTSPLIRVTSVLSQTALLLLHVVFWWINVQE